MTAQTGGDVFRWAVTAREIADAEDAYEMSWEEIMMRAWPPKPVKRHKDAPHTAAGRDGDG